MKKQTVGSKKHQASSLQRSANSWNGAYKLLQLLEKAEVNADGEYEISTPIATFESLDLLSVSGKIQQHERICGNTNSHKGKSNKATKQKQAKALIKRYEVI